MQLSVYYVRICWCEELGLDTPSRYLASASTHENHHQLQWTGLQMCQTVFWGCTYIMLRPVLNMISLNPYPHTFITDSHSTTAPAARDDIQAQLVAEPLPQVVMSLPGLRTYAVAPWTVSHSSVKD